jgi:small subunit ribosomal protein S16
MAVKLRMKRMGRRHKPFFRIVAIDSREPRNGKIIERLGHYDPLVKDPAKQIVLKRERIEYWLTTGAVPSETVAQLLENQGIKNKIATQIRTRRDKARAIARKRGVPFTKAERDALQKKAEAEAVAGEQAQTPAEKK